MQAYENSDQFNDSNSELEYQNEYYFLNQSENMELYDLD
jgi:hypothetical protein